MPASGGLVALQRPDSLLREHVVHIHPTELALHSVTGESDPRVRECAGVGRTGALQAPSSSKLEQSPRIVRENSRILSHWSRFITRTGLRYRLRQLVVCDFGTAMRTSIPLERQEIGSAQTNGQLAALVASERLHPLQYFEPESVNGHTRTHNGTGL